MPNRIIKESICTSENIDRLTPFQETVFVRLIVNCDDYGRFDARPKLLVSRLFPLRDIPIKEMEEAVRALQDAELITVYVVDGHPYLFMNKWLNHQQKRSDKSKYPDPVDTESNQMQSDDSTCNQMISDDSKFARNRERERNTYNDNRESLSLSEPLIDDEEAHKIQKEHDSILEAAKNAGFKGSPSENADLIKLYAEYGYEKMIAGFTACVEHSAANLAYLRAVLKGEPRKQVVTQTRVLPAQNFEQRDYSGVDDELKAKLAAEMAEFKRNGGLQNAAG